MRFVRYPGTRQMLIETAEDLEQVLSLDEALWVATSAPTSAFRCDPKFLALVDGDKNGRIRNDELKDAIRWLLDRLADRQYVQQPDAVLPLSAIRAETPVGQALVDSSRYILDTLAAEDKESIALGQVRTFTAGVKSRPLNGDAVLVPAAADDADLKEFVADVAACTGGVQDEGGAKGIAAEHVTGFMAAVKGYLEWKAKSDIPEGASRTDVMVLGTQTPQAFAICQAHAEAMAAFFAQCHLIRFRPDATAQMQGDPAKLQEVDVSDAAAVNGFLASAPIAQPNPEGVLRLAESVINDAYVDWVAQLNQQVLKPILGAERDQLTETDWQSVTQFLAPYAAYVAGKQGAQVEGLPSEKLLKYRDGDFHTQALVLIEEDKRVGAILDAAGRVEQLLLYCQNLLRLVNNFVSFPDFYNPEQRALFETGSAVIDGRWFNLAVRADDVKAHSAMAKLSNICTVYLEVTGMGPQDKFQVAVPVTSGTKGNLSVGKRGVFYDIDHKEWDARVTQILEHPISLREAIGAPFARAGKFVAGKIESLAGAGEGKVEGGLKNLMASAQQPAQQGAGGRAGMFIGVSLAVAALSSAFAFIVKTLAGLKLYQIGLGILGLFLVVMIPMTVVAFAKLRRRDLSALLEGCGWAINARMKLSRAQGKHFTSYPRYPAGAIGAPMPGWQRAIIWLLIAAGAIAGAFYGAKELKSYLDAKKAAKEAAALQQEKKDAPAAPAVSPAPEGK